MKLIVRAFSCSSNTTSHKAASLTCHLHFESLSSGSCKRERPLVLYWPPCLGEELEVVDRNAERRLNASSSVPFRHLRDEVHFDDLKIEVLVWFGHRELQPRLTY